MKAEKIFFCGGAYELVGCGDRRDFRVLYPDFTGMDVSQIRAADPFVAFDMVSADRLFAAHRSEAHLYLYETLDRRGKPNTRAQRIRSSLDAVADGIDDPALVELDPVYVAELLQALVRHQEKPT